MASNAWPFLIARGRHHGYRTLLAPDFLVADRDYGVLDDSVVPVDEAGQVRVVELTTRRGRRLTVVHTIRRITDAEIQGGDARDEHGRPLDIIYGFVCADGWIAAPDPADLEVCAKRALDSYAAFLDDEDGFPVDGGPPFALRSRVGGRPPAPFPAPGPASRFPSTGLGAPPRPGRRNITGALIVVVLLAAIAVLIVNLMGTGTKTPETCGKSASPEVVNGKTVCPSATKK